MPWQTKHPIWSVWIRLFAKDTLSVHWGKSSDPYPRTRGTCQARGSAVHHISRGVSSRGSSLGIFQPQPNSPFEFAVGARLRRIRLAPASVSDCPLLRARRVGSNLRLHFGDKARVAYVIRFDRGNTSARISMEHHVVATGPKTEALNREVSQLADDKLLGSLSAVLELAGHQVFGEQDEKCKPQRLAIAPCQPVRAGTQFELPESPLVGQASEPTIRFPICPEGRSR